MLRWITQEQYEAECPKVETIPYPDDALLEALSEQLAKDDNTIPVVQPPPLYFNPVYGPSLGIGSKIWREGYVPEAVTWVRPEPLADPPKPAKPKKKPP